MREEEYVIQRALENDFYKLTMGQFIFHQWGEKWPIVRFSLKVRTPDIPLSIISESRLREEFEHAFTMVPNRTEMHYLRGTNEYERRMFEEDYLDFLGRLNTIPIKITINKVGESYDISFEGPWAAVTNCEVRGLAIVKRLYVKYLLEQLTPFERKVYFATARVKLYEKIKRLFLVIKSLDSKIKLRDSEIKSQTVKHLPSLLSRRRLLRERVSPGG